MRPLLVTFLLPLFATACSHPKPYARLDENAKVAQAPAVTNTRPETPPPNSIPQVAVNTCQQDWECGDGSLCLNNRCVSIKEQPLACQDTRVHFDFDDATVRPTEKPALERTARCLKADRKMQVLIDGNADERGTIEYNLALGDKRARAVAQYLEGLGASDQQIATVTYGKDRPLCTQHDESCWAENRRAGMVASSR